MAKALLKAFATVSCFGIVTRLLAFLFKVYLSRRLGAEMLGVYQITFSVFMLFIGLSASGIPTTISRKTAENDALLNHKKTSGIFTTALLISVGTSLVITLFFVLFPNILSVLFTDKRCIELFVILLPSLLSTAVYCTTRAWFWGKRQYAVYSGAELFEEVSKIIITATLISLPVTAGNLPKGVAISYVAGDYVAALAILIFFVVKGGKFSRPKYLSEVTKSALPLTSTRVFGSILSSAAALLLPIFLIKTGLSTAEATSEFGRMSGMVMPLLLAPTTIVGSLAVVIVPELAGDSKNHKAVNKQVTRAFMFSAYIVALFLILFMTCGDDIGILLYNDARSGVLLTMSALLMLPLSFSQLACTMLNSLGKESWTFLVHVISSIVLILSIVFLPSVVGIMAYPIGLFLFHSVGFILNTFKLKKTTDIKLTYLYKSSIIIITSIAAVFITAIIKRFIHFTPILNILILSCIALILFAIPMLPMLIKEIKSMRKGYKNSVADEI